MQTKVKPGTPALLALAALLAAALLLVGLTGAASAGDAGGKGNDGPSHGKCKKPKAGHKKKCKHHRPKPGNQNPPPSTPPSTPPPSSPPSTPPSSPPSSPPPSTPPPATPPAPTTTTLAISPTSFDFGNAPHGGFDACQPDPDEDCPTHDFTVTNTGAATSGVPTASITEIHNPEIGGPAAFRITANTCTAELAPGASCSIRVKFAPNSNAGDETFSSRLDVTASPGSAVSSELSGMGL